MRTKMPQKQNGKVCHIVPKLHHSFWHFISSQVQTEPGTVSAQCI